MVGSDASQPGGGPPATLSATITAIAPASWQFFTLTMKPQVPRSTSAMLPADVAGLVSGEQAFERRRTGAVGRIEPATTVPVTPGDEIGGPRRRRRFVGPSDARGAGDGEQRRARDEHGRGSCGTQAVPDHAAR